MRFRSSTKTLSPFAEPVLSRSKGLSTLLLAAASAVLAPAAAAQSYPVKPARIVVAFVPGGATDILGRLLSARFTETLGQPFPVENRAGAGGTIGAEIVAKSPPDGYTLLMTSASLTVNVTLYPNTSYNGRKDFAPIVHVASSPLVLTLHPSVPARSVKELVALSKKRKDGLNFASNGAGTTSHLAGVMLSQMSGLNITQIHYKGSGGAQIAMVSGETDMGFPAVTSGRPHIAAGRLKALAISTKRKSSVLPDVPTLDSMYPGFDIDNWFALFAPAGTPQPIIARLHDEAVKGLQHPDMQAWIKREGAEPVGNSTAEFTKFFSSEIEKFAKVVKASGVKAE